MFTVTGRATSRILLLLFLWAIVAPAALSAQARSLAVCCRRDGAHHCAMSIEAGKQDALDGKALGNAAPKCPLRHAAAGSNGNVCYLATRSSYASIPPLQDSIDINHDLLLAHTVALTRSGRGPPLSL
jgi:hypothetical protein